jgi:hypothetical protein
MVKKNKIVAGSEPTYLRGHVEVDDPLHVGNVESPRHYRGGHQDGGHSLPELGQRLLSLPLQNTRRVSLPLEIQEGSEFN